MLSLNCIPVMADNLIAKPGMTASKFHLPKFLDAPEYQIAKKIHFFSSFFFSLPTIILNISALLSLPQTVHQPHWCRGSTAKLWRQPVVLKWSYSPVTSFLHANFVRAVYTLFSKLFFHQPFGNPSSHLVKHTGLYCKLTLSLPVDLNFFFHHCLEQSIHNSPFIAWALEVYGLLPWVRDGGLGSEE